MVPHVPTHKNMLFVCFMSHLFHQIHLLLQFLKNDKQFSIFPFSKIVNHLLFFIKHNHKFISVLFQFLHQILIANHLIFELLINVLWFSLLRFSEQLFELSCHTQMSFEILKIYVQLDPFRD